MGEKDSATASGSQHGLDDGASAQMGELTSVSVGKTGSLGEAADVYGDVEVARDLGYVKRGLKSRHMQFIALGGTIGTGLFLGIGSAFLLAGPLSVLLGFSITGFMVHAMMTSLGEMTTWLPLPGAIPQYCARYVDPAMGFAVGWNIFYMSALAICAEISAAAILVQFWDTTTTPAAWISILIVVVVVLNVFAVAIYGEAEFVFAAVKIVAILGLLMMAFIVDLGGNPQHDRLGFRYWRHPGPPMKEVVQTGAAGRFLGFFSTLIFAAFSYGGVEMVAVAAGETADPRRNVPRAVRRLVYRIVVFYVLGSLAIGVLVPANNPQLGRVSPWVLACTNVHIPVLPHIINAVIVASAASSANAFLFVGSRYLFALAQNGHAPRVFLRCTARGIPIYAVGVTALFSLLAYMSCSSGANNVFQWFLNLGTVAVLFTWVSVLVASLRFRQALQRQGVARASLPYRAPLQPYAAWAALVFFSIVILFNGWTVFTRGRWSVKTFLTSYIGVPIYFGLYLFWKLFKRTHLVDPATADLWSGKAALDALEWPDRVPRNLLERIWFIVV